MTEVKKKEIVYCSRYPLFSIFTECLISKGWLAVTLLSCETSKKQHSFFTTSQRNRDRKSDNSLLT